MDTPLTSSNVEIRNHLESRLKKHPKARSVWNDRRKRGVAGFVEQFIADMSVFHGRPDFPMMMTELVFSIDDAAKRGSMDRMKKYAYDSEASLHATQSLIVNIAWFEGYVTIQDGLRDILKTFIGMEEMPADAYTNIEDTPEFCEFHEEPDSIR